MVNNSSPSSHDGNIHCLDPSCGTTLSKWPIHSKNVTCIVLESNSMLIPASTGSSVSFWNTTTRKQIGSVIDHKHDIYSMAISDTNDLVVCGQKSITLTPPSDSLFQVNPVLMQADLHTEETSPSAFIITLALVPLTASVSPRRTRTKPRRKRSTTSSPALRLPVYDQSGGR